MWEHPEPRQAVHRRSTSPTPTVRRSLHDLVAGADVFITNLLPGARRRFRIDVDELQAVKPGLVYAPGERPRAEGPRARRAAASTTPTSGPVPASPTRRAWCPTSSCRQPGPALGDLASGAFLAGGIAAALVRRGRTGQGAVRRRLAAVVGDLGPSPGRGRQRPVRHRHHPPDAPPRPGQPAGRGLPHRRRAGDLPRRACRPSASSRTSAR